MIRPVLGTLALAFALAHSPYVVSTLEDIDSVNFALGIRDFDVATHRPHPPGYPIYIAAGKVGVAILRPLLGDVPPSTLEARTLSLLSLVSAIAAVFLLYRVFSCLSMARQADDAPERNPWQVFDPRAIAATALTVACPLFWYLAVRPLSDVPGLTVALAAQATLALAWWRQRSETGDRRLSPARLEASGRMIVMGALLTGIAIGFRSQNALLTVPLFLGVLTDRIGRGVAGALIGGGVAMTVGILAWVIPLIVASNGVDAYLAALGSQAGEDFAGGQMLYLNPSDRRLAAYALIRTVIYPWDSLVLGGIILALSLVGMLAMLRDDRRAFVALSLLSLPYLGFHLLFQDTSFVRYALPLIPPMALLAVRGLELLLRRASLPIAGGLGLWSVAVAAPVVAAYGSEPSPTARVLQAMQQARDEDHPGALAYHHTFQRPLEAETVPVEPRVAAPPRREWLEIVRYWRDGRTEPLWFLGDPRRSDLALVDPRSRVNRTDFGWRFSSLSDIGGMRPAAVAWYRMPPPGWFAEEGWALTPETAGIARLMGRGPAIGPITAWLRRRPEATRLLIGGRHLGSAADPAATFVVAIDAKEVARWEARAGFFLHVFDLPEGTLAGQGALARLTVESQGVDGSRVPTAIEQFDLQSRGSMMWAFDEGWHEAEYDPSLGVWRWTSDRSVLQIIDAISPIAVTFRVERPSRYYDEDPVVSLRAGDRVLGETRFRSTELWSVVVPLDALTAAGGRVSIETNRTFTPAERGGPADHRRLGLRVFAVNITPQP